jgi:hypothetical protein
LIRLVPIWSLRRPAPVPGYIATPRTCARTRKLHCWNVRANRSEASWQLTELNTNELKRLSLYLCRCLVADPSVDTARNHTWIVAIVGYHGIPVYRAVACMSICVSVTSVAIW